MATSPFRQPERPPRSPVAHGSIVDGVVQVDDGAAGEHQLLSSGGAVGHQAVCGGWGTGCQPLRGGGPWEPRGTVPVAGSRATGTLRSRDRPPPGPEGELSRLPGAGGPDARPRHPPSQTQPYSSTLMHTFMAWSVTGTKRTNLATMGGSRSFRKMS